MTKKAEIPRPGEIRVHSVYGGKVTEYIRRSDTELEFNSSDRKHSIRYHRGKDSTRLGLVTLLGAKVVPIIGVWDEQEDASMRLFIYAIGSDAKLRQYEVLNGGDLHDTGLGEYYSNASDWQILQKQLLYQLENVPKKIDKDAVLGNFFAIVRSGVIRQPTLVPLSQ